MAIGTDITSMQRKYRQRNEGEFPEALVLELIRELDLRYGENPNQAAAIYRLNTQSNQSIQSENRISLAEFTNIRLAKSGKQGLSATNYMDVTRALDILKFFDKPSVAVMKHAIPSGYGVSDTSDAFDVSDMTDTYATQHGNNSLDRTYVAARDADARSAFGSVVVTNSPLDKSTAQAIVSTYVEVVACPEFEEGAMGILEQKKDLRAIFFSNIDQIPKYVGDDTQGIYDIKGLSTGRILVQEPYLTSIRSANDLVLDPMVSQNGQNYVVERIPTERELNDMLTAWYVNIGVRSNGIVIVKDGVTVSVGSGQQERVGAVEQAIIKGMQKAFDREGIKYDWRYGMTGYMKLNKINKNPFAGAVCSSDAFFPFADSIERLTQAGVTSVIQPGGSIRDYEVIDAANKHNMAMAFTLERCFGHF